MDQPVNVPIHSVRTMSQRIGLASVGMRRWMWTKALGRGPRIVVLILVAWLATPARSNGDPMAPPRPPKTRVATGNAPVSNTPAPLLWTRVGADTAVAWYGGHLVQVGSEVNGARIEAIAEDHIVVSKQGRRHRVPLLAEDLTGKAGSEGRARH